MNEFLAIGAIFRGLRHGRLTMADCRLLISVCLLQLLVLAALDWVPIPRVRRALVKLRRAAVALRGDSTEARVVWAIETTGRWRAVGNSCLARALAAELLLPQEDLLTVVIGVTSPVDGRLASHAWIERNGRILIGGDESTQEYRPLIAWSGGTT